jgi:hypothetical protein
METHFENIKEIILKEINKAEFIIHAAIAWITDYQIIQVLIEKLKSGVQVELVINNDDQFEKRMRQFSDFRNHGGRLFLYNNDNKSLMHNKFCIIDLSTTITGSYNWSFSAATLHKENIIIERDNLITAKEFSREFKKIKKTSIIFENKGNYYDVCDYAFVKSIIVVGEPGKDSVQVQVESGDTFDSLMFEPDFIFKETPKLDKIYGYWKERVLDNLNEPIVVQNKTWYRFECLDPNFIEFLD